MAKTKKKLNGIHIRMIIIPILFLAILAATALFVWQTTKSDGPVYGNRCAGVAEVSKDALTNAIAKAKEDEDVKDVNIYIDCKTIKIDLTLEDEVDYKVAKTTVESILHILDDEVGMTKSNSNSAYSDLLGRVDGKNQYDVDITIVGSIDYYPAFGTKHPKSDKIYYTWNEPRDKKLIQILHEQQDTQEEDAEEQTEDQTEE